MLSIFLAHESNNISQKGDLPVLKLAKFICFKEAHFKHITT